MTMMMMMMMMMMIMMMKNCSSIIKSVDSICRDGTDTPLALTNETAQISRTGQL